MRTVLFLINGFGIETKDSYSVYNKEIMPNFDKLINGYIFSQLETNSRNIYDGFRNMSQEREELYNYSVFSRELNHDNILKNPIVSQINEEINTRKSKLHLLCFLDTSMKIVDNLKTFLKAINKERDKKIFLHIVLTSDNYQDYPAILDVLSKINMEFVEEASIGMVMGLENILNTAPVTELNFLLRNMISELGEKWKSFKQKLDVSYGTKQAPLSVKPFVVNTGFSIESNDMFLIWNYDNVDISNFMSGIESINYGAEKQNQIKFYSLFPITYKNPVTNILNYEIARISLASNMKGLGFKTLVLTGKDTVSGINYYLNGLESSNNPNITYMAIDNVYYDGASIVNILNTTNQELVIINYEIKDVESVEDLKSVLTKIDNVIGMIYDNSNQNSYTIIISSLFGTNRVLTDSTGEICNIAYSKVPIIYVDRFITKKDYLISEGNTSSLLKTCYKSVDKKYPGTSLVIKKNLLYRLFFK